MRRFNLFSGQFIGMPRIEVKTLDIYSSFLQSLLARGDRKMGGLLTSLVSSPSHDLKKMIGRLKELIPNWQQYFIEKESPEVPWSQIIFRDRKVLWQRWLTFKRRLKEKRR